MKSFLDLPIIARSNFNTRQSACLLSSKADAHKSYAPKKTKLDPLKIADVVLAMKKPDNLLTWLDFDGNFTKLIKFIVAVCDKYNKLAVDYNNLDVKYNKLAVNYNNLQTNHDDQLALKNQKKTVI